MKILAFETSCDDTSIALFEDNRLVCMHTKSQIKIHNKTGGVVPEVASREHANAIFDVLQQVLDEGKTALRDIDYIAVTTYPGLIPSLLTGVTVASTLSQTLKIPIIPINHIEAHIFSNWLERDESEIQFPLVCLTVSGGHNEVWYMRDMWTKEKLGQTQDDAAGEAYDKVAKMMGLGYPGGPIISKLAEEYNPPLTPPGQEGDRKNSSPARGRLGGGLFPRVFLEKSEFGFSFSGLKSAVKREVDKRKRSYVSFGLDPEVQGTNNDQLRDSPVKPRNDATLTLQDQQEISFEFQNAVNEVLCYKILEAARQKSAKTVLLAGGVSANDDLRVKISKEAEKIGIPFLYPTKKLYCMDNAAMIGILAYYRIKYEKFEKHIGNVEVGKW